MLGLGQACARVARSVLRLGQACARVRIVRHVLGLVQACARVRVVHSLDAFHLRSLYFPDDLGRGEPHLIAVLQHLARGRSSHDNQPDPGPAVGFITAGNKDFQLPASSLSMHRSTAQTYTTHPHAAVSNLQHSRE